jgi:hypothetical protein
MSSPYWTRDELIMREQRLSENQVRYDQGILYVRSVGISLLFFLIAFLICYQMLRNVSNDVMQDIVCNRAYGQSNYALHCHHKFKDVSNAVMTYYATGFLMCIFSFMFMAYCIHFSILLCSVCTCCNDDDE